MKLKFRIRSKVLPAALMMATSAIGPGFLTQTAVFTQTLAYNFAFIIVISILIDIIVQLNIWRISGIFGLGAVEQGNALLKSLGSILAIIIFFGGLIFNIGNLAGAGMGLNSLLGIKVEIGSIISTIFAIFLFSLHKSEYYLDFLIKVFAIIMMVLVLGLLINSKIDYSVLLKTTFLPERFDIKATMTLVGGTVGGYISFAGAQKLLDLKIIGKQNLENIDSGATTGILVTGFLRYILFIGALGMVISGQQFDSSNPASSIFEIGYGQIGKKVFGLMLFAASITSVFGATYTSITFVEKAFKLTSAVKKSLFPAFILVSIIILLIFGKPVNLLLMAGWLNSFVLPLGLAIVLTYYLKNKKIVDYKHSSWLLISGFMLMFALVIFAILSIIG